MGELLERDNELLRLRTLLDMARAGHGRVAFIAGEAGIGKTTLVSSFATAVTGEATTSDVRVAVGRCEALVNPRALGPMLDAAENLGIVCEHDRDALLVEFVADIRRNAAATVLVIEDAHWADVASVDLLVMLGRRAVDLPLLLIVTCREDEVPSNHAFRQAIGDLVTASSTVWLGLLPLTTEAVHLLADDCGVRGIRGDDLFALTGGNPFFVTEALAAPSGQIPTSVRLAVLARASRLDPAARSVLDALSVVPGRVESWLAEALGEHPDSAIDACIAAGTLTADRGTYAFRHELARLAIETGLPDAKRRRLNQRAVEAISSRADADPARVAHHAAAAANDQALARWASRACLLAAARTAHREAVHQGELALSVRQFLSADEQAELQTKLAISLISLARAEEAETMARRAVEHWQLIGNDRREAEALLVLSATIAAMGHTERSMLPLGRAVDILQRYEPGQELTLAYGRLASAHMLARERDLAVEWGQRAIALATEQDDAPLLGRALIDTGIADVMDGCFDGLKLVRAGIELGRERDLPGVVAYGLRQIGSGLGEMRRYADAMPALIEGSAFMAQHSLEADRRYQVAWLARCRFDLGQWDDVELLAGDAITGSRTVAVARFVGLNTLGWLRARRGDADVFPLLDEALDIARETRHLQRLWPSAVARAEAGWLEGSLEPHVPLLEEVFELAIRCGHGVAAGEIGVWLSRCGRISEAPPIAAPPFASWIKGKHMDAVAGFRQLGCQYEAAWVLAETGEMTSLREALATFNRLGAAPMARQTTERLRDLGVRFTPPVNETSPAPPRHPSGVSDRELEVLRLVTAGFTNPQIAASLFISRKTAEHHVSSILMKLGATTRSEAAAVAIRLGLVG